MTVFALIAVIGVILNNYMTAAEKFMSMIVNIFDRKWRRTASKNSNHNDENNLEGNTLNSSAVDRSAEPKFDDKLIIDDDFFERSRIKFLLAEGGVNKIWEQTEPTV